MNFPRPTSIKYPNIWRPPNANSGFSRSNKLCLNARREWISPAAVAYIAHELLEKAGKHADMLREYDFYLMPLVNPDG